MYVRDTTADYKHRDLVKFMGDFVIFELEQSHADMKSRSLKDTSFVSRIKHYRKIQAFYIRSANGKNTYEYACNPVNGQIYASHAGDPLEMKILFKKVKSAFPWTKKTEKTDEEHLECIKEWPEKNLTMEFKADYYSMGVFFKLFL